MENVSLQNLIKDVALACRDLATGATTSTSGSTSTFVDSGLSNAGGLGLADNQYAGTQAVFEEPVATAAGLTTPGAHTVVAFLASTGQFTVQPALRGSGTVPSGLAYFLVRGSGRGNPYAAYVGAVRYALDELDIHSTLVDTSLTTSNMTYDYVLPAPLAGVYRVCLAKAGFNEMPLLPRDWGMNPGRKLHLKNTNIYVAYGWTLNVYGVADSALPATLDGTVYGPRNLIVELASEYVQRSSTRQPDNQRASLKQQERLRFNRLAPMPNLRMVIP